MPNVNFNGYQLEEEFDYLLITGVQRQVMPPSEIITENIPARPGVLFLAKKHGATFINVQYRMHGDSLEGFMKDLERLASYIDTEDVAELILSDELDRTYYAIAEGTFDIDRIAAMGKGTINFICPDPYKYGIETTVETSNGTSIVTNPGTVESFPKFEVEVNNPITFFAAINEENYVLVGAPDSIEAPKVQERELYMDEYGTSMTDWVTSVKVPDGGTIGGSFKYEQGKVRAQSYGEGTGWHGPAISKGFATPLQNFEVEAKITLNSTYSQVGRIELYMIDSSFQTLGKIAMKEMYPAAEFNEGEARVGDFQDNNMEYVIKASDIAHNPKVWNDFHGIMRITRKDDLWTFKFAKTAYGTGKESARMTKTYRDKDGRFLNPIKYIMIHVAQNGTRPTSSTIEFNRIRIYKLNDVEDYETPTLALPGDVLEIDNNAGTIYKNGELFMQPFNPSTTWFSLKPGSTELAFEPRADITVRTKMRGRWK